MESAFKYQKQQQISLKLSGRSTRRILSPIGRKLGSSGRTMSGDRRLVQGHLHNLVSVTRTCEQDEELKVRTAAKVSRAHFS